MSPVRSSMYCLPSGKSSSGTSPPCFWNCGTAAGAVLSTRHGAVPAVIDAPIASSAVLPAGISWAVTFSSGCASFHAATISLPHATSSVLLEYQMVIGPFLPADSAASPPPPPLSTLHAVRVSGTMASRAIRVRFIASPNSLGVVSGGRGGSAQDQLGRCQSGVGDLLSVDPPVDQREQRARRHLPPAAGVGAHGGERRGHVAREGGVVEAGERRVLPGP